MLFLASKVVSQTHQAASLLELLNIAVNWLVLAVTTVHVKLDLRNPFQFSNYSDEEREIFNKSSFGGKISPSLLNLKHLSYLDLSQNNFNGNNITKFLGSLENLKYLNLSFSMCAGVISPPPPAPHLGNLSKLQYLDLNFYRFSTMGFTPYKRSEAKSWVACWSSFAFFFFFFFEKVVFLCFVKY